MLAPLRHMFAALVATGDLTVVDHRDRVYRFGDGAGRPVRMRLADGPVEARLLLHPNLALGEAYMDGRLVLEAGSIYDLLQLLLRNAAEHGELRWMRAVYSLRYRFRRLQQYNPVPRARRNARAHYDIDGAIYDLFLEPERHYSCAYFDHGGESLEQAQRAKMRHIAAKLDLRDGLRVLDIGCGWGGLSLYLAEAANARVRGVTLSETQLGIARKRASEGDLAGRVDFALGDYRAIEGRFDRIVSVGMFEHVGVCHYPAFFAKLKDLMRPDGVALVHAIGRFDGPATTNPFIAKHVFPGGYAPALSEVLKSVERSGLFVTDIEILRLHYAETLRQWRRRFLGNWSEASRRVGERFCRMWEFYLAASEAAFRYQNLMVFQLQLTRELDALPLTRAYMAEAEHRLAARDAPAGRERRLAGE